jgi:hypothetical protein
MKPWWMAPAWVACERCRGPSVAERRTGGVDGPAAARWQRGEWGGGAIAERRRTGLYMDA